MTAWHPLRWFGDREGMGCVRWRGEGRAGEGVGGLQNKEGKAEEVKIEDGE